MRKNFLPFLVAFLLLAVTPQLWASAFSSKVKKFKRALATKNPETIASSIRDIASVNSKKAVQYLLKVALVSDNFTSIGLKEGQIFPIYKAALEGLKSVTDTKALAYMIKQTTRHRNWQVRVMLIDVIKGKSGADVEHALAKSLKSRRQEILLAALEAVKYKKSTKAVPNLIDLYSKYKRKKGLIWIETRRTLLAITGQDFETSSDWKKWWSTVKSNFNPKTYGSGGGRTVLRKGKRPKLFGTEVVSKRVVFILDISGSMEMKDPEPGEGHGTTSRQPGKAGQASIPENRKRIIRAKNELVKVVKMLDGDVRFNIIAYSNTLKKWKDKFLFNANPANKASAVRWIEGLKANGTTWTDLALKQGFTFKEANTFYLLSDGSPTHDGSTMLPTGPICEMVKNKNKFRRVRIFTLGFMGANRPFMQRLSDENYGKYNDIR